MDAANHVAKPALSSKNVKFVLEDQFGFPPKSIKSIKELASYDDQNFCVKVRANADNDEFRSQIAVCSPERTTSRRLAHVSNGCSRLVNVSRPFFQLKPEGRKIVLKITNWKDSENKPLISE